MLTLNTTAIRRKKRVIKRSLYGAASREERRHAMNRLHGQ